MKLFNKQDRRRDAFMLTGSFAKKGYDWWWHSFTAVDEETGEEKPFFVEFFLCNPALGGAKPILGQTPANKALGLKPSYLMVKVGCWGDEPLQLHRFFGWNDVTVLNVDGLANDLGLSTGYQVQAGDCFASETRLRGSVTVTEEQAADPGYMCEAGSMSFDLTIDKQVAFNVGYGAGSVLRALKAFEMYWHAQGMKSQYSGTITLNGRKYKVDKETSYGYADKNWGCGFTSPWVWLSSNDLTSRLSGKRLENSVFDIGGGRPKAFGIALERQLLSAFWYEGTPYEFNFSKFWTGVRTKFDCRETEEEILWHVQQETWRFVMDTEVRCRKDHMLLVNYEEPDGRKRHNRLYNGGDGEGRVRLYRKRGRGLVHFLLGRTSQTGLELLDDIDIGHVGCEYGEFFL